MTQIKRRTSVISEFIIFLLFVLFSIIVLNNFLKSSYNINSNLNLTENSYENTQKENEVYIKSIKDEYGINIVYGNDSENLALSVDSNVEHNVNVINTHLKQIKNEFKKYPNEVFDIFKSKKYFLKIVIVNSFNNNNIALTSKNTLNEFKIYISNTERFDKAFHHEMYHVLEYYMADTHKYIYKSWYKLNPSDFKYVSDVNMLDNEYVLMSLTNVKEANVDIYEIDDNPYFVTLYSKSTEREDRAEIFSEIMILKSKPKYLNDGQNILKKALYIDDTIKECITHNKFYYSKFLE